MAARRRVRKTLPHIDVMGTTGAIGMVPEHVRRVLFMSAWKMFRDKRGDIAFSDGTCDVIVTTEGKTAVIGALSGIVFRARVVSDGGDYQVNYLIAGRTLAAVEINEEASLPLNHWHYLPTEAVPQELRDFNLAPRPGSRLN